MTRWEVSPGLYNSICNICLLTAEENQSIGARRPNQYLADSRDNAGYFKRKMDRHLIPVAADSGVRLANVDKGFNRMLRQRNDWVCEELEKEAGIRLFRKGQP